MKGLAKVLLKPDSRRDTVVETQEIVMPSLLSSIQSQILQLKLFRLRITWAKAMSSRDSEYARENRSKLK